MSTPEILQEIKRRVSAVVPTAEVLLYGSYARGEQGPESDIDLLILVDKSKVSYEDRKSITYPLYGLEMDSGIMISPIVLPRAVWDAQHGSTPLFKEVARDGRRL